MTSTEIAIKHPDVFCAVASHSPVRLSFEFQKSRFASLFSNRKWYTLHYARIYSPNPNNPPDYANHLCDASGAVIDSVWQRWLQHDPLTLLRQNAREVASLRTIYMDCGDHDGAGAFPHFQIMHDAMVELGILHEYEPYKGGHLDKFVEECVPRALTCLSNVLFPPVLLLDDIALSAPKVTPGMPLLVTARVTPSSGTGGGGISMLTADLSGLGGDASAVMVDDGTGGDAASGDGTYTVRVVLPADAAAGERRIAITLRDHAGRVVRSSAYPTVIPAHDEVICDDDLGSGWRVDVFGATYDPLVPEPVLSGRYSQGMDFPKATGVKYSSSDPAGFNTLGYTHLEFYINPGTSSLSDVSLISGTSSLRLRDLGITFEPDTWTRVSIPLEDLGLANTQLGYFTVFAFSAASFHIDDLRLVVEQPEEAAVTAVEELADRGMAPPRHSLSQSYPNPFNATAAIPFEIAVFGRVDLSVYTVLGQKVRTLLSGERVAGHYTVIWDGADEGGRRAASGVYLYRLTTEGAASTRKAVLLE